MAGKASKPRSPPPRRRRPCPDSQLPWRAGVACFSQRRPARREEGRAAGPAIFPPTLCGVHPSRFMYAHITWRGTRGWDRRKVAVLGCGRCPFSVSSSRSSSVFTRHTATRAHYQTVALARGQDDMEVAVPISVKMYAVSTATKSSAHRQ